MRVRVMLFTLTLNLLCLPKIVIIESRCKSKERKMTQCDEGTSVHPHSMVGWWGSRTGSGELTPKQPSPILAFLQCRSLLLSYLRPTAMVLQVVPSEIKEWENQKAGSVLPEEVAKKARVELREEDDCREQALQQFVDWVVKNQDLQNVRTDAGFLLRFLRVKKFSVPMAEIMLMKYLNLRQTFQHLFYNLDFLEPSVLELIDNGYLFPSPVRDKNGRKVIIGIAANFDPHKYTNIDMAKVHSITYETLMDDEVNQVVGYVHFGDFKGVSTAHVTLWSPTEFATIFKWGDQSVPMRHKEVHCLNVPSALKYVYDFARSRISQKIRDRFIVHDTLEDVHSKLDPKVLPKEYGGDIPMAEMINTWKKELAAKREKLLALDNMKLLDNSSILKKNSVRKGFDEINLAGSFRKLEVD